MMNFLTSIFLVLVVGLTSADVTPLTSKESFRDKVLSMLRQHGTAKFDSSITEEIAEQMYNKHINNNNNDPTQPISIGTSKPFVFNRTVPNNHPHIKKHHHKDHNDNNQKNNGIDTRRRGLTSTGWEDSDKQNTLDIHNGYRNDISSTSDDGTDGTYPSASNMNYLFWDDALASVAQTYSDTCYWGHNSNRNNEFYDYTDLASFDYPSSGIYIGENIAIFSTTSSSILDTYLTERIGDWWAEYDLWHYQTYSSSTINGAGHFTQIAWADTRYLGCGFTYCEDGSWNEFYLVCNYYPGGNYIGQYPYEEGTCSANTCDGDRTITCDDNLCGGCMDPSFIQTGSTTSSDDCTDGFIDVTTGASVGGDDDSSQDDPDNTASSDDDVPVGGSGVLNDKTISFAVFITVTVTFIAQLF